jgi:DNA-binding response OmpR family regulator
VNPRSRTILVIDDDMAVQMFVTQVLKIEGYQVLVAADLEEALHVSDVHPTDIHLILTDIMLPSTNGMALAQALVAKRPGTPVLYMSGAGSAAIHAIQFEGAPRGEFLEKPFTADMLATSVRALLLETATGLPVLDPAVRVPSPREATTEPVVLPSSSSDAATPRQGSDAIYRLESAVRCPQCQETILTLQAVRLLRTQVNFTSTLPRRGRVLVCPSCAAIVSAELTTF